MGHTLFLGLLLGCLSRSIAAASRAAHGSGTAAAGADVGEEVLYVLALERLPSRQSLSHSVYRWLRPYLGEELGPDGLDILNLGGFEKCLDLVGLEQAS